MPRVKLDGKPILITGASSGIGAATAERCAAAGMPVLLMARRADRLDEVAQRIRDGGGKAESFVGDVTEPEACREAVRSCVDSFGSVYAVYANAGYGFEKATLDTSEEELRGIFEVNFWGMMNVVRPAAERMVERGEGHVLACSSSIGKMGIPFYGAYCATKAAQWPMIQALRGELLARGVYASTVHPIGTRSEFFDEAKKRSAGAMVSDNTPAFLMQSPDRVARAIVRCLHKPKLEVWTSLGSRLAIAALVASPGLADVMNRAVSRKKSKTS